LSEDFAQSRKAAIYWITAILFILSFIARIDLTLHRTLNADEFQHLHGAWMVHLGFVPYRDFWENHTPLLYYVVAPILALLGEGVTSVLVVRGILSAVGLAILWIVYRLTRLVHDHQTAIFSVVFLSYVDMFLQKTIEVRPDQFLVLFWLLSLWLCLRTFRDSKDRNFLLSGLLLGIGMLFSPKALFCYSAAAVTILFQHFLAEPRSSFFRMAKRQIFYTLGFLLPFAAMILFFYSQHAAVEFVYSVLLENLNYPNIRRPTFLLLPQNIVVFLVAFAGIIVWFRERRGRANPAYGTPLLLIVPCFILLAEFLFLTPGTFPQSALIFVPLLSIFAGIAIKRSLDWSRIGNVFLFVFLMITGLIVPCVSLAYRHPFTITNGNQFQLLRYILTHTARGETIFDGNTAYIFRPQAYYYGSLVEGIRERIKRGEISRSIPESLKASHCRIVIYDDRISDLPAPVQAFLRANYLPSGQPDVFVAGKELSAENFSGRKATFWIDLPFRYSFQVTNAGELQVDGKSYKAPVLLDRGMHQLLSDQDLQRVVLLAE